MVDLPTASSMILRSLRLLGEKVIGDTLTANEQTAYLADLNTMLDGWSIDWSMIHQILQENCPLVSGTASYTIGPGGAFSTTRPTQICDPCFVRDSGNLDYPLTIIDSDQYGSIRLKSVAGTYPRYLFYDNANVNGMGTIFLYPKPTTSLTLYIDSWKQLQQFAVITSPLILPPGYQRAIESNFAIEVSGGFANVDASVIKIAKESLADVKRINSRSKVGVMNMPVGIGAMPARNRSSIFTG